MGKFDGYLLLSDIDGTLTDSKGKLPQSNAEATVKSPPSD